MLETFVDSHYHAGTIYRADNWTMLGHTRGYRRISGGYSAVPVSRSSWCSSSHCGAMQGVSCVRRSCRLPINMELTNETER